MAEHIPFQLTRTVHDRHVGYSMPYPDGSFTENSQMNSALGLGNNLPGIGASLNPMITNTAGNYWIDGVGHSNISINQQYYVDKQASKPHSTGAKHVTFICKIPGSMGVSTRSYRQESWSHLNYELQHNVHFLYKYGNENTMQKFMEDWDILSIQQGEAPNYAGVLDQRVQNHHVGGRTRTYCPWVMLRYTSSQREVVNDLDVLFIVARRYPLPNSLKQALAVQQKYDNQYGDINSNKRILLSDPKDYQPVPNKKTRLNNDFQNIIGDIEVKYNDANDNDADMKNDKENKDPNEDKSNRQYYWRLEPYVSSNNCDPPLAVYSYAGDTLNPLSDDNTHWTGCFWRVGKVTEVHGEMKYTKPKADLAKQMLFPNTDSDDYKRKANKLDDVVLFFGK